MVAALLPGAPPNVTIVPADILAFDIAALTVASPLRVAGNLPYNLSSPILFRLLAAHRATGRIPDATRHAPARGGGADRGSARARATTASCRC